MTVDTRTGFRFGEWEAYPLRNLLAGPAGEVRVEPKVMQLLERLAARTGDVVERDVLLEELWSGRAMSDEPLTRCIATLRRVLDDSAKDPVYVQTIPKRGYRLVCPVEALQPATQQAIASPKDIVDRRRLVRAVTAVLAVAIAIYAGYRAFHHPDAQATQPVANMAKPATAPAHSVAVLPFANLSPNPDNEYLSDGLAAELLNRLTAIPELKVAARTSAFAFKGHDSDIAEIAGQLHVAHVLEGSVRQSGDRLRISVQLINAEDGYHIWANTWERPFTDVFEIQDEVAAAVVNSLRVELLNPPKAVERTDPEAYRLYLRGRESYLGKAERDVGRQEPSWLDDALSHVTHSLAIDPDYAPAWSLLAAIQFNQAQWMTGDPTETYARASAAAERALDLDPSEHYALSTLAAIDIVWGWDYESAARRYRQALDIGSGPPDVLDRINVMYSWLSYPAPTFVRDLPDRDPLNAGPVLNDALGAWKEGRFNDAREKLAVARRLAPNAIRLHVFEALFAFDEGDYATAARLAGDLNPVLELCSLYRMGRIKEAQAGLDALKSEGPQAYLAIANVHACWDEPDRAFDWLQRAFDAHDPRVMLIRSMQLFENLQDDPRWEKFLDQAGIADEIVERVDHIIRGGAS